jgi:hypothetical protein
MPRHAGGNSRLRDWTILAVKGDLLPSCGDDNLERSLYDRPLMPRYAFVMLRLTIRFVSVRLGHMPRHGAQIFNGRLFQSTTNEVGGRRRRGSQQEGESGGERRLGSQ